MIVRDVLTALLLLSGVTLTLVGAIGLHRFPDVFARMHAATKPATLGLTLVVIAVAANAEYPDDIVKLLLVLVLQFLTAPVGAHMVGRAAYLAGTELSEETTIDELAEARAARASPPAPD